MRALVAALLFRGIVGCGEGWAHLRRTLMTRPTHSNLAFIPSRVQSSRIDPITIVRESIPSSWNEVEKALGNSYKASRPVSVDSVLSPKKPSFYDKPDCPILFRERHGWCPYSERVFLALEMASIEYYTIRIDNTGGPRPSYYAGQTPQMKWPDTSRVQGESLDLVEEVDER